MTIRKFLDLSTMHTIPEDLEALHWEIVNGFADSSSTYTGTSGAVVWTRLTKGPGTLLRACKRARELYPNVDYLMFDADAPIHEDFPIYEEAWS